MQDYKNAAANDQDQSHLQNRSESNTNTPNEKRLNSLEFAQEVLEHLEAFTLQKISDPEQRALWLERLSRVPHWKMLKLSDFTGRIETVWKFFDDLRNPPHSEDLKYLKQLPEPTTDIARDVLAYVKKITSDEYAMTPAGDQLEREFMAAMKVKYPRGNWICARRGN